MSPYGGWYGQANVQRNRTQVFAPLRGWYLRVVTLWAVRTSFRPLTGIVPDCVLTETMDGLFSPPYGDGTPHTSDSCWPSTFSPPYGDGTKSDCNDKQIYKFSPPYGDGTRPFYDEVRLYQFSPPYGDCTYFDKLFDLEHSFSPPCGDGTGGNCYVVYRL